MTQSYHKADRGVSPVVGVILMVAVTVLLSVSVGAIVFGMAPSSENVNAAVSVDEKPNSIDVTVTDMGNADYVVIEDPQEVANLSTAGESTNLVRSGCRVTVYGVKDGQRTVLTSFHASIEGGTASLVSMWSFEDCQREGDELIDSTGAKTGTVEDNPQSVEGVAGKAYHFDGDADRIYIGSRGSFRDITVSVWVKPKADDGWIGGNGAKWRIRDIPSNDQFEWWIRQETTETDNRVSFTVNAGENISDKWWHVVGTYNSDTGLSKLYLNGQLMHTEDYGFRLEDTGHDNMVIADSYADGNDPSAEYDTATIDEFRIYSTELSEDEIQDLCERDAPAGHPCEP